MSPYIVGHPIDNPECFYGCQNQVDRFFEFLNGPQAQSLQVIGIRRAGKTSFLKYISHPKIIRENVKSFKNTVVAYVDLQNEVKLPSDFYVSVAEAIKETLPGKVCSQVPNHFSMKRSFDRWMNSLKLVNQRLIILLDEIEILHAKSTFDVDFFTGLRSLVGGHFAWVTTSFRDFYRVSQKMGADEKSSPFFNVFHPTPIVLGQFNRSDAITLIKEPVKECGLIFSNEVIEAILSLTGRLPYFIQAASEKWVSKLHSGWSVQNIRQYVKQQMLREMSRHFDCYWSIFNSKEKYWLQLISSEGFHDENISELRDTDEAFDDLFRYGLLTSDDDGVHITNEIFAEWVKRESTKEKRSSLQPGGKIMQDQKNQKPKFPNAHAVIIGVGDYIHATPLPASAKDAMAIANILKDPARCGYSRDNIQLLTNEKATGPNIRGALKELAQATDSDSTVILFFSGHGVRAKDGKSWHTYLCPREIQRENIANTAIPGNEFSKLLASVPSQKMLVIIDACHAGGSADLKTADGETVWKFGLPDNYYEILSRGSGRVVIASSKEDQVSYVRPQGDLSVFTWHLLEALSGKAAVRGDGLVHVLDVFHHINGAVQADKPDQTPILKVKDMDLNFSIALSREGKGSGAYISGAPIAGIRDQIISDPIEGAKALSDYLKTDPKWASKRNDVDLKRSDLKNCQENIDRFGPDPAEKAAKYKAIYYLLRVCLELEQIDA